MMELNQLREFEKERRKAEQKREEEVQLKSELLKQMEQLKMKEEEGQMIKREEEELEKQKLIIDAAVCTIYMRYFDGPLYLEHLLFWNESSFPLFYERVSVKDRPFY